MLNIGGGEFLVICLAALVLVGPAKLPEVARQVAAMVREVRKVSSGFQNEMRAAMQEPAATPKVARDNEDATHSREQPPAVFDAVPTPQTSDVSSAVRADSARNGSAIDHVT